MKKKFPIIIVYFLIGIIFAAFISYSAVREAYRNKKIEVEVEALQQEAKRIQIENDSLSKKIAYFETPEFQEKIAKEKLNLQKPDENVVVVKPSIEKEQTPDLEQKNEQSEVLQIPIYKKWLNFFFKYN